MDTNTYCDYAEGLPDIVDIMATHSQYLFIPSIVLGELHSVYERQQAAV